MDHYKEKQKQNPSNGFEIFEKFQELPLNLQADKHFSELNMDPYKKKQTQNPCNGYKIFEKYCEKNEKG
jgi:hypothetical protein